MGRYSDINRGPELQDAYEKLQEWRKKSRSAKKAAYDAVKKNTARVVPKRIDGYIRLFNSESGTVFLTGLVLDSNNQPAAGAEVIALARNLVDDRFKTAAPNGAGEQVIEGAKGYKFAKVTVTKKTGVKEGAKSRTTDDTYKKIITESASCIFGRKTAVETFADAAQDIRAKPEYKTFEGVPGNSIKIVAELG